MKHRKRQKQSMSPRKRLTGQKPWRRHKAGTAVAAQTICLDSTKEAIKSLTHDCPYPEILARISGTCYGTTNLKRAMNAFRRQVVVISEFVARKVECFESWFCFPRQIKHNIKPILDVAKGGTCILWTQQSH
jgi:hypothetical protein